MLIRDRIPWTFLLGDGYASEQATRRIEFLLEGVPEAMPPVKPMTAEAGTGHEQAATRGVQGRTEHDVVQPGVAAADQTMLSS